MNHRRLTHGALIAAVAVAAFVGVGCTKSSTPSGAAAGSQAQAAPPNDSQIATGVRGRLQGDSALAAMPIQAQAVNGIVTLSGTVSDEAARELAANDAAQVNGVRTVVNNLTVQAAQAAAPQSAAPHVDAAQAPRQSARDHASEHAQDQASARRLQREQARQRREEQRQREQQQQAAVQPQPPVQREPVVPQSLQQQAQNAPPAAAANTQTQQPPAPPPPPQPVRQTITIPAGTDLPVRITESLASNTTQANDTFHGVLADNLVINGQTALRRGAKVTGVVLDAKDASHFKGQSELSLGLQQVRARNQMLTVSTDPIIRQGAARGKNTAEKAGGAALLGTLIGALAGGGRGALVGAAAGAGAGAGSNAITRGQQVQIPSETLLHFTLNQPLNVTVTTTPGSNAMNPGGNSTNPASNANNPSSNANNPNGDARPRLQPPD